MKLLIVMLLLAPNLTWAAKEDREFKTEKLEPGIASAQGAFKEACGCNLSISVDEKSINTIGDMNLALRTVEEVRDGAGAFCKKADDKKVACKMKSLEIKSGAKAHFKMDGSKGIAIVGGGRGPSFEDMTHTLDD
jgi:hypothetical protein